MNTITPTTPSFSAVEQRVVDAAIADPSRDFNSLMATEISPLEVIDHMRARIIRHYLRHVLS